MISNIISMKIIMFNYAYLSIKWCIFDHNMKLCKMIEIYLKYDNMHIIGTINAFICINNHVNPCINSMLSDFTWPRLLKSGSAPAKAPINHLYWLEWWIPYGDMKIKSRINLVNTRARSRVTWSTWAHMGDVTAKSKVDPINSGSWLTWLCQPLPVKVNLD